MPDARLGTAGAVSARTFPHAAARATIIATQSYFCGAPHCPGGQVGDGGLTPANGLQTDYNYIHL